MAWGHCLGMWRCGDSLGALPGDVEVRGWPGGTAWECGGAGIAWGEVLRMTQVHKGE